MKIFILNFLDKLYRPLFTFIPIKTFRYGVCGAGNAALNIILYFFTYNFIAEKQIVHIASEIAISPHIFAFIVAFLITFPIGFYLNLFVVFPEANRKKRIHLIRYFMVVCLCVLMNYVFIKFFVEQLGFYPTPSAMLTTVIVSVVSYLLQKRFSFKKQRH